MRKHISEFDFTFINIHAKRIFESRKVQQTFFNHDYFNVIKDILFGVNTFPFSRITKQLTKWW